MSSPWIRSLTSILEQLSEPEQQELKHRLGTPQKPIEDTLLDPERVAQVVRSLSQDGIHALKSWVIERGFWRSIPHRSRLDTGVQELIKAGWVFETSYGPYQRHLIMPWELMPRVLPLLWDIPWDAITLPAEPEPHIPAALWDPFWHDLFQILSFARVEPLLLTTQGDVYRRQKVKMEKLLWDRGPQSAEGAMVDYLLEILARQGLLASADHPFRYIVHEPSVESLFAKNARSRFAWLAEYVFDPGRQYWPVLLWVSLSSIAPDERALNRGEAARWLQSLGVDGATTPYLMTEGLRHLILTGFWERSGDRLSPTMRASLEGRFEEPEPGESLVQPTGEILVPPTVPLSERWAIDGLATRVRSDRVSTYRLDQEAVKRGVLRGLDATLHQRQLSAVTRTPIPDNVRVNLEDWYRAIGRHRILEVTLIHSGSTSDSHELESILGPEFLGRLSPTDIIIGHDRVKEVRKRLEKGGVPILPDVLTPSEPEEDAWVERGVDARSLYELHLPDDSPRQDANETTLKARIHQALRSGSTLTLTFLAAGDSTARTEPVIPVSIEPRWIQAYLIRERRYVLIEWQRIIEAE